jgi:hypothetical protein
MIDCKQTDVGFEITWDPDDPTESVFNTWTEEDFIRVIIEEANRVIEEHNQTNEENEDN